MLKFTKLILGSLIITLSCVQLVYAANKFDEIGLATIEIPDEHRDIFDAARDGSVIDVRKLGQLFYAGILPNDDFGISLKLFELAASNDDAAAYKFIGHHYNFGKGVAVNYQKALMNYQQAAALGDGEAKTYIGWYHELGRGIPINFEKALAWYLKAAAQDDPAAHRRIGNFYANGTVVSQNWASRECTGLEPFSS